MDHKRLHHVVAGFPLLVVVVCKQPSGFLATLVVLPSIHHFFLAVDAVGQNMTGGVATIVT